MHWVGKVRMARAGLGWAGRIRVRGVAVGLAEGRKRTILGGRP